MKLIVGLGNPGKKFLQTRHNLGFMLVDNLATTFKAKLSNNKKLGSDLCLLKFAGEQIILAKPQKFMNHSGLPVAKILARYQIAVTNLLAVHDDLDIALGEYKIQFGKGPKIHNGVNSLENHLQTKDFWRLRLGVAGKSYRKLKNQGKSMAEDYVLKPFLKTEQPIIKEVIKAASNELLSCFLKKNVL